MLDLAAVRTHLKNQLADYKVPKHIEFRSSFLVKILKRSSSAACVTHTGSRQGGGSELTGTFAAVLRSALKKQSVKKIAGHACVVLEPAQTFLESRLITGAYRAIAV